ncbi:secretin N-terminal domain-containing protein [Planctomycetaceae bacterium SH139]
MKTKHLFAAIVGAALATASSDSRAQQPPPQFRPQPSVAASPAERGPDADAARSIIRNLSLPAYVLNDVANSMGLKYAQSPGVSITADTTRGELLILAPRNLHPRIDTEIREMLASGYVQRAGRQISTATTSRQFQLRTNSWREFEDGLQSLVGQRLQSTTTRNGELASFELVDQPIGRASVTVDRRANAVTVVAPEPMMAGWEQVVASLDMQNVSSGEVLQMTRLQNAEPAPIQRAIRLLRQIRPMNGSGDNSTVGVAGNNVRFMGTAFNQQEQSGGAPQAGQPPQGNPAAPGQAEMPVEDGEGGLIGDVQIQFVPELGVLIVRGAKKDVQRVMDVIKQIEDAAVETQPLVEIVQLQHVDSEAMATLVTQLYTDVLNTRGSSLSITGLVKPNALLLIGRKEAVDAALELVAKLDTPVLPSTQLKVFRLRNASAVDAEEAIREFFSARPGSDEDLRPVLGTRVRIIADYRTNSLIVQAAPRDMSEVSRLIQDLDVDQVPAQDTIRVFPLKNSIASELAPVLQASLNGEGEATAAENFTRPSTTLSILEVNSETGQTIESGLLANVVVTSDDNANALVVRGPGNSMALIGELIKQLDQLPGAEALVKVFQLEFSDATAVSTALNELFAAQQQQGGGGGAGALNLPLQTAAADNSLVQLRFSTDPRTNSVIAVGSESDLEVVESIVLRLDTEGFAARETEVIWLRNAPALEVAAAIQQYVQLRQQSFQTIQPGGGGGAGGIGVYDLMDRDLIVVGEEITNSLLLSVSPRLYPTIRRMIDQLDRLPPNVMVKVILAEVRLGDGFEWGSEFGIQDSLLFDRGLAGAPSNPGFNFNGAGLPNNNTLGSNTVAPQSLSTFGLGRASDAFGYGGFVFAAASDSVSLLLRSLQDANRAQILSRPVITARDQTIGLVQVGQTVPRVSGVNQAGAVGGTQVTTTDEEVGLILQILPRVGSDGTIRLEVDAERSRVGPLAEGIPVGFDVNGNPILSPRIDRTRAQTTVTAYSGQTVVLGGLIQKDRSQFSRRIPYVSNIPYLGALFRYDQERETRTELLIIMTPQIISGDEDWEYIKQEESSRMSWCLADVVEMHGDVGLNGGYGLWGPAIGPVIYPDATPMIDDIERAYMTPQILPAAELGPGEMMSNPGNIMVPEMIEEPAGRVPGPVNVRPGAPGFNGVPQNAPNAPSVIEPVYPVAPTGGVRQVRHADDPAARPVRLPQRIPSVR